MPKFELKIKQQIQHTQRTKRPHTHKVQKESKEEGALDIKHFENVKQSAKIREYLNINYTRRDRDWM